MFQRAQAPRRDDDSAETSSRPPAPDGSASNRSVAAWLGALAADRDRPEALHSRPLSPGERAGVDPSLAALTRVYTGPGADRLARRLAARAFSAGRDIVLSNSVAQRPASARHPVMAHELAHVAQRGAAAPTTPARLRVGDRSTGPERQAARAATTGQQPKHPTAVDPNVVQRWEPDRTSASYAVVEGPLETAPTDLDPDVEEHLASLCLVVERDLASWERYRSSFAGGMPGWMTLLLGQVVHDGVYRSAEDKDRLRRFLALRLESEKLYLLRELLSFWAGEPGRKEQAEAVGRLFGLAVYEPGHRYRVEGDVAISGKLLVGGSIGTAVIRYDNDLGMSYSLSMGMGNIEAGIKAKLKAPFGKLWRKIRGKKKKGGGKKPETPDNAKPVEVDVGVASSDYAGETRDVTAFWAPSEFGQSKWRPARFSIIDAGPSAKGTAEAGNRSVTLGGVKYQLWKQMIFFSSWGRKDLWFDLALQGPGWKFVSPEVTAKKDPALVPDVDVEAGLASIGYGLAWGGQADVTAPEPPPPERVATGNWVELARESVFFDTGQTELTSEENQTLGMLADLMADFWVDYPDYELKVEITGHASPRWRHPQRGETPHDLNLELSQERAEAAREQLANAIRAAHTSGSCDFEIQSCVGDLMPAPESVVAGLAHDEVQGAGTFEAVGETADPDNDWWGYRRADIVIKRTEIALATHEPAPLMSTP